MSKSFSKTILDIHRIPIVSFIVACLLSLRIITTLLLSWTMWLVALLVAYFWQIHQIHAGEEVGVSSSIISQEEIKT